MQPILIFPYYAALILIWGLIICLALSKLFVYFDKFTKEALYDLLNYTKIMV